MKITLSPAAGGQSFKIQNVGTDPLVPETNPSEHVVVQAHHVALIYPFRVSKDKMVWLKEIPGEATGVSVMKVRIYSRNKAGETEELGATPRLAVSSLVPS